jgi:hypothetical protein
MTIWVTCVDGAIDHAVTDEAMTAGVTSGTGTYQAVCGALFLCAPLVCPPRPSCPRCLAFLHARSNLRGLEQRMSGSRHSKQAPFARLLGWLHV